MKCPDCRLCLDIINLPVNEISYIFYGCELCRKVYRNMKGKPVEVEEKEIKEKVEKIYEDKLASSRKLSA